MLFLAQAASPPLPSAIQKKLPGPSPPSRLPRTDSKNMAKQRGSITLNRDAKMQELKTLLSLTWEMQKAHGKSMLCSHCRVWEPRCLFSTHHYCNDATALLQCCLPLSSVPGHDTAAAQPRCISAVSPAAPFYRRSGTSQLSPLPGVIQPLPLLQPFTFKPCTLLPRGSFPNHSLASPA